MTYLFFECALHSEKRDIMYNFITSGVCSRKINFDIIDNKITSVNFEGGCDGNLKGISRLIEGLEVEDAIKRLKGITCGSKTTSCPDQLSKALEQLVLNR